MIRRASELSEGAGITTCQEGSRAGEIACNSFVVVCLGLDLSAGYHGKEWAGRRRHSLPSSGHTGCGRESLTAVTQPTLSRVRDGSVTVLEEILKWSRGRPAWQRDALRRLVLNGELSDDDILALAEICKAAHGLAESATS